MTSQIAKYRKLERGFLVNVRNSNLTLAENFWIKVNKTATCWIWTAAKFGEGYGSFYIHELRRNIRAHRVSYMLHFGEIPEGLYVCHKCDNPSCVNPEHLFVGTHSQNMKDCSVKGRKSVERARGFNAYQAKITPAILSEIRSADRSVRGALSALAKKYDLDLSAVCKAANKETYRFV